MQSINLLHTDVLRRLQKLDTNKSPGPDNLHPRLLKEIAAIIAEPLRRNFQTSLTTRELPGDCKIANITLVFKKGNRSKPENYRPISLTSVVVKILERIVDDSILKHLTTNKILSPKQHGFQSGKLIETNLLESYEETTDLIDQGNPVDLLLLDFAKAFDKVPHSRLHSKISAIGINQAVVDWLMNFLTKRKQKVRLFAIDGKPINSDEAEVMSGVPQGIVLGPAFFLISINDIFNHIDNGMHLFADDPKLFGIACPQKIKRDIDETQIWTHDWLLQFNAGKCCVLHLGTNGKLHDV